MSVINSPNGRTSVSIPRELILEIDRKRGDVSRSRFFLRMIEKSRNDYLDNGLQTGNKKSVRDTVDERTEILKSTVSPVQ
jgi:metal-responsive CopG/Arc/MetJ family transcriptional regulator